MQANFYSCLVVAIAKRFFWSTCKRQCNNSCDGKDESEDKQDSDGDGDGDEDAMRTGSRKCHVLSSGGSPDHRVGQRPWCESTTCARLRGLRPSVADAFVRKIL